ncbi:TolC family protein [Sphingobacterium bovisgrunnientis]|uniref:TolC family protein n=1 Tax=Sphingobacterium bovisgrunnientis TaxID=1874697 RepID=UPI0013599D27|nr:TolC family protein [Sphingobacterium bovisgrunnientis]
MDKTKTLRKLLISVLFFLFSSNNIAQTQLTIEKCFDLLEQQNDAIKQANLNILLNQVEVKDAKNSFLPTLNFSAGHTYNLGLAFDQISGQLVTGNKWSNNANANISTHVPIFQGFTLRNRLKQSFLALESGKLQKAQILQSLKLQVLTKYIEATAHKSLYEVSLKQLSFAKEQLRQEMVKFDIGTNTTVDIAQAESTVANNELLAINNLASYHACLVEIKQLIGVSLSDSISLQDLEVDDIDRSESINYNALTQNLNDPIIAHAKIDIQQYQLNLKYAKAAYYPSLSFFGGYGTNYSSERTDFITGNFMPFWNQINQNRNLNFGLSLSLPIFNAFKTKNNISRFKIDLESKQTELKKVETERQKIFVLAVQEYHKSIKEQEVQLTQMSAQQKNLVAVKERYDIGVSNAIEYNKALLEFNLAEANVIKSKYTIIYNLETLKILEGNPTNESLNF